MGFDIFEWMADTGRSFPDIKLPGRQLTFKEKIYYTLAVVLLYYALLSIDVIGVKAPQGGLDFLQMITASRVGSFLTLGIGPIILASIFLQLLSGAGLLDIDLKDPKQKVKFHEAQRTLTVFIALFEAIVYTRGILAPSLISVAGISVGAIASIVAFQLLLGAIIVMYLDELVTKYGIGSGISLFIAAGVSLSLVSGFLHTLFGENGIIAIFAEGGALAISRAAVVSLPFFSTVAVFLAVAYGEGTRVKLPIHISMLGQSRPLELPLFYVSNIPVIFAAALLLNLELFAVPLAGIRLEVGGVNLMDYIVKVDASNRPVDGLLYLITPMRPGLDIIGYLNLLAVGKTPYLGIPEWVHAIIYVLFLSLVSIMFGLFWVETSNMDAKSMAEQLSSMGAGLKGFRFDRRLLEKRLDEYITPLTVLGSFLVGVLAGVANLAGAYGTGTGILLTVGILYRFYLQIREGLEIYFPGVAKILLGS